LGKSFSCQNFKENEHQPVVMNSSMITEAWKKAEEIKKEKER